MDGNGRLAFGWGAISMDSEFLLTAGFALLLLLVGWSDQLRELRSSTRDVERQFLKRIRGQTDQFRKLFNKNKTTLEAERLEASLVILGKALKADSHGNNLYSVIELSKRMQILDALYSLRFWTMLGLATELLLGGIVLACMESTKGNPFIHRAECWASWLAVLGILLVLVTTVIIGIREKGFRRMVQTAWDLEQDSMQNKEH
jgi:hypothetical protein